MVQSVLLLRIASRHLAQLPLGRRQCNRAYDLSTELESKINLQHIANQFSLALTGCLQLYLGLLNRQFDLKHPVYNRLLLSIPLSNKNIRSRLLLIDSAMRRSLPNGITSRGHNAESILKSKKRPLVRSAVLKTPHQQRRWVSLHSGKTPGSRDSNT